MTKNLKGFGYSVLAMKRALSWILVVLLGALAQQVQLPNPSGPVVEARSPSVEATLRLQGCTRDQGGQVVCSLQVQSTARTNQQVTVLHQSVRAISARGFSYPGYLVADGGNVEGNRSTFALPAGARVAARLIFPKVPQEETAFAAVLVGGVEFRGIPIGTQAVQGSQGAPQQVQAPAAPPKPREVLVNSFQEPIDIQVGEAIVKLQRCFPLRSGSFVGCNFIVTSKVEGAKVLFEFSNSIILRLPDGNAYEWSDPRSGYKVQRQDGGGNPIHIPVAETPFAVSMERYVNVSFSEIIRLDMQLTYFTPDDKKGEVVRVLIRNAKVQ